MTAILWGLIIAWAIAGLTVLLALCRVIPRGEDGMSTQTWPQPAPLPSDEPYASYHVCADGCRGAIYSSINGWSDSSDWRACRYCPRCGRWLGIVDGKPVVGPPGWAPDKQEVQ